MRCTRDLRGGYGVARRREREYSRKSAFMVSWQYSAPPVLAGAPDVYMYYWGLYFTTVLFIRSISENCFLGHSICFMLNDSIVLPTPPFSLRQRGPLNLDSSYFCHYSPVFFLDSSLFSSEV